MFGLTIMREIRPKSSGHSASVSSIFSLVICARWDLPELWISELNPIGVLTFWSVMFEKDPSRIKNSFDGETHKGLSSFAEAFILASLSSNNTRSSERRLLPDHESLIPFSRVLLNSSITTNPGMLLSTSSLFNTVVIWLPPRKPCGTRLAPSVITKF